MVGRKLTRIGPRLMCVALPTLLMPSWRGTSQGQFYHYYCKLIFPLFTKPPKISHAVFLNTVILILNET